MAWILLAIAIGLAIGLLILSFGARRAAIGLIGGLVVLLGALIWYADTYDKERTGRVPTTSVRLDNFAMTPAYGGSFRLYARARNDAEHDTLEAFGVTVTASDCVTEGDEPPSCVVIGEQSSEIRVSVPPKQARDINEQIPFPPMRPQGELSWSYRIDYVRSR